jgi:hypothetical protein
LIGCEGGTGDPTTYACQGVDKKHAKPSSQLLNVHRHRVLEQQHKEEVHSAWIKGVMSNKDDGDQRGQGTDQSEGTKEDISGTNDQAVGNGQNYEIRSC